VKGVESLSPADTEWTRNCEVLRCFPVLKSLSVGILDCWAGKLLLHELSTLLLVEDLMHFDFAVLVKWLRLSWLAHWFEYFALYTLLIPDLYKTIDTVTN
jgi:hypothetical protein